jgi:heme-degrading monooxygenase HmoA
VTASRPNIARVWRGRTRPDVADEYEAYNYEVGIRPLIEKAMGVQTFREDREDEVEFVTISYWRDFDSMAAFTGGDPDAIHHLDRDPEYLIRAAAIGADPAHPAQPRRSGTLRLTPPK